MFKVDQLAKEEDKSGIVWVGYRLANMLVFSPSQKCQIEYLEKQIRQARTNNNIAVRRAEREVEKADKKFILTAKKERFDYVIFSLSEQLEARQETVVELTNAGTMLTNSESALQRMKVMNDQEVIQRGIDSIYSSMARHYEKYGTEASGIRQQMDRERVEDVNEMYKESWDGRKKLEYSEEAVRRVRKMYDERGLTIPSVPILKEMRPGQERGINVQRKRAEALGEKKVGSSSVKDSQSRMDIYNPNTLSPYDLALIDRHEKLNK